MSLAPHFKVPGVYITDVAKFTKYSNVKGACKEAGIELYKYNGKDYNPLSVQQLYVLLRVIRARQARRKR
jgi:hypothetical protein